jgi:membrane protein implicated in regulation of membrane protease activity
MKLGKHAIVIAIATASLGLGASAMAQVRVRSVPVQPFARNFTATLVAQTTQPQAQTQARKQTFTGTIAKADDGSYVLEVGGASYRLDDQSTAAKYVGKQVKVTGTLDASTDTIHVSDIQPAT